MGKDVVVTTGTGSGKTECFLLPIFSYLIKESRDWTDYGDRPDRPWWLSQQHSSRKRIPQRHGENRPAAIRALILYPLNALVEDQLMRLRRHVTVQRHIIGSILIAAKTDFTSAAIPV